MRNNSLHFSRYRSDGLYALLSVLAILSGGLIYIFFRPSEIVFFSWIREAGFSHWIDLAREWSHSLGGHLPEWIVYSLPNGLWAFAYALLITLIWGRSVSLLRFLWMASIPVLVLGFELMQYAKILSGTFSMQDIFFGMVGLMIGILLGINITKPENHEKAID